MSAVDRQAGSGTREPGDLLFVLANVAPDAMHVKDTDGRYLFVNEAFARLVGMPVHRIIGRTDTSLFANETAWRIALRDETTRSSGAQVTFVEGIDLPGFGHHVFHTIKGPIRDETGAVAGTFGISRDITDVDVGEAAPANRMLLQSARHYGVLVNKMRDGVFVAQNHRVVMANPALETMLGYAHGELVDVAFTRLIAPEFLALWTERFDARIAGRNPPGVYEVAMVKKGGDEIVWIEINANLIDFDAAPAVLGIVRDVGERRRLERALLEQGELENRLAHVIATAPGIVHAFRVGADGSERFLFVSPGIEAIYGTDARTLERDASGLRALTHPDDRSRLEDSYRRAVAARSAFREEYRVLHPTRGEIWIEIHSLPRAEPDGSLIFTGFISDITERKRRELDLHEQTQEMLDRANDSIIVRGPGNVIEYWNGGAERLYGWSAEEAIGRKAHELLKTRFSIPMEEVERRLLESGSWVGEFEHETRSGERITVASRLTAKIDARGNLAKVLAINQDITAQRAAERRIRELNEQLRAHSDALEAQNKELQAFSYSVSHDLKAPLRGIDGYSRMLLEDCGGCLDDEGRRYARTIREAAQQMGRLIGDLLAYARIDRRERAHGVVALAPLIAAIVDECKAGAGGPERTVVVDLGMPTVEGEPEGIASALRNLIDNAFKFTQHAPAPRIAVRSRSSPSGTIVEVEDNGIGFDMKYQEKVFEMFQRLQRNDEYPGTGIGLAIVRKSMERMGGRAWADSAPGRGATFHLEFPPAGTGS